MEIRRIVGQNIKNIRKYRGLSQIELAKAIKLTRSSVVNMESGKLNIGLDNLYELSLALQVPITSLFNGIQGKNTAAEELTSQLKELQKEHEELSRKHKILVGKLLELAKENES
ncbi:helix-turn-helix transcriptional regulator [Mesobacillus foraminis]|uniref:helix-turn-helix domain-containing protein n=1 Tax=Mesobacillus foraminis TaxID=279826 RepID=UPI0039A2D63A